MPPRWPLLRYADAAEEFLPALAAGASAGRLPGITGIDGNSTQCSCEDVAVLLAELFLVRSECDWRELGVCKSEPGVDTVELITPDVPVMKPHIKEEPTDAWDIVTPEMSDGRDAKVDEMEDKKLFMESINCMADQDVPLSLSPGSHDSPHISGNLDLNEAVCSAEEDPLSELEIDPDDIGKCKPFVESINCMADDEVPLDSAHNSGKQVDDGSCDNDGNGEKVRFRCPDCDKDFISLKGYRLHQDKHGQTKGRAFECEKCGDVFSEAESLAHHTDTECTKKLQCNVCKKFYNNKYSLKKHMTQHGNKEFHCEECDKYFYTVGDLKRHQSTHSKVKIHTCEYCGKMFNSKDALRLHKYNHEGRPPWKCKLQTCDECGYSAVSVSRLTEHMRKHTGEKPFACTECGLRFPLKRNLLRHMRIHKCGS